MTAYSTVSDVLMTVEFTFVEDDPFEVVNVPLLERQFVNLDDRFAGLPEAFRDALFDLYDRPDAVRCARCDTSTAFVLAEQAGFERLFWQPTGLARLADGPVVVLCEDCTPYVPAEPEVSR